MARYDWPRDLRKPPETLAGRAEANAARANGTAIGGDLGNLAALGEVIEGAFDEERQWMPLGPFILRNGQADGDPVVAGRIRDIQVHPNGQRAYAGAANGGVWYTDDAGESWAPLGSWALAAATSRDDLVLTVGALLVEWGEDGGGADDPALDAVYVGTGELKPYFSLGPGGKHAGIGVLRLNGTVEQAISLVGVNPWQREGGEELIGAGIYRLARDPGTPLAPDPANEATLLVATSRGLFMRQGRFVEDQSWTFVDFTDGEFTEDDDGACTDLLWTDQGLFVALMGADEDLDGIWLSTGGPTGTFQRIALPDHDTGTRLSLAASPNEARRIYVAGLKESNVADKRGLGQGWLIDLSHTPAGVSGTPVAAVSIDDWPVGVYTSSVTQDGTDYVIESDQSHYDQCITVVDNGSGDDVVFIGGQGMNSNALIFRLPITGTAAANDLSAGFTAANQTTADTDPTFAGRGIHADVHALRPANNTLWVSCDGGVFTRPLTAGGSGTSRNVGLPTLEPGYVQSHPTLDGHLIAGLQDNGFIERIGGSFWDQIYGSDGGGCAYHPTRPHMVVKQTFNADWDFIPARQPRGPAVRHAWNRKWDSEKAENGRASFYSNPLVLPGETDDTARVFIGTDRIWMTNDWYGHRLSTDWMSWVTLPSATDPHSARSTTEPGRDSRNRVFRDQLRFETLSDKVVALDALVEGEPPDFEGTSIAVLCERTVRIFTFEGNNPSWTGRRAAIISGNRPSNKKAEGDEPDPFLDYLPYFSGTSWTAIARHTDTTLYVTTSGRTRRDGDGELITDPNFDTLWWYNGDGRWYPTGLHLTEPDVATGTSGTPASAHAVLVDPDNPDVVWVGTRVGVFEGQIDQSGAHPSWTWRPIMDGLPQTLVEDLSLFRSGDRRYLRAALVSLGVWERDVSDTPHSVGRSYIRTFEFDTGRGDLPDPAWAPRTDPSNPSNRPLVTHNSPDILFVDTPPIEVLLNANEVNFAAARSLNLATASNGFSAFVQVHHRHVTPLPAADIQINLFYLSFARGLGLDDIEVSDNLRNAISAGVTGTNAQRDFAIPDPGLHLRFLRRANPEDPLFSRKTGIAHFDTVDLTRAAGEAAQDRVALIAVLDPANRPFDVAEISPRSGETTVTLDQVMRRSAYLAARAFNRFDPSP